MTLTWIRKYNFALFFLTLLLSAVGMINLYSATLSFGQTEAASYFQSQLIYHSIGFAAMLFLSFLPIKFYYQISYVVYVFALILLIAVLVIGSESKGAQSWIRLGAFRLQPSEIGKIALVLALSRILADKYREYSLSFIELIPPLFIYLIPTGLVVLQNDLGSSLFYGFILASLLMIQGINKKLILLGLVLVATLSVVSYQYFLKPYQKARIASFMNPEADSKGSGYQLWQSKVAIGSGGLTGKGFTKGQSHKLKFLPERHTDFIFPVLLEEWGFVGGAISLFFYGLFLMTGVSVMYHSSNRFGFFLSAGLVSLFFWHLVINLGGVLGLMPLTGVPLPFFSYGGSSLLTSWMAVGILISASRSKTH